VRWARVPRTGAWVDAFDYGVKRPSLDSFARAALCRSSSAYGSAAEMTPGSLTLPVEQIRTAMTSIPGCGATASSQAGTFEVEDDPDELGLVVEQLDRRWSLLLRVPEMPDDELGLAALTTLHAGFVEIFAGDAAVERISALDVRPGVGVARPHTPSLQPQICRLGASPSALGT